ncbi:DUF2867 domain-containing protein [Desulfohalovibrio reitneri]|uniref:DUF2867 domain-containing protein n=1 Tax=Desulfohalovibrio reitneri TaxID=1307759 RepID=UPI0004A78485|nr:DUF2867 domain-containing protein [Desulfohalovibrio reitneri]
MNEAIRAVKAAPELAEAVDGADHLEGLSADSRKDLRAFLAGLSSTPTWMEGLYKARQPLARLLRVPPDKLVFPKVTPDNVPFAAGARYGPFTVRASRENRFWLGGYQAAHLSADLAVLRADGTGGGNRYHLVTAVRYRSPRGKLYFGLVRPFHHLVMRTLAHRAAR